MIGKFVLFLLRNRLVITILLLFATVIILYLTMVPADRLGNSQIYEYDKLGHFGLFFIWTFIFGLYKFSSKNFETKLIFIFIAGSLFGVLVEVMQEILPYGRQGDVHDALADIAGSFSATLLLFGIKKRYFRKYRGHNQKKMK
jgi:VanZ family protein